MSSTALVELFVGHGGAASETPELAQELSEVVAIAKVEWPGFSISDESFVVYLAQRLEAGEALASLRASDLYLALACSTSDEKALEEFEAKALGPAIRALHKRFSNAADLVDEVIQQFRVDLLVGGGAELPKLLEYQGRGKLVSWLRVAATRRVLNALKRASRERPLEDARIAEQIDDGELGQLRRIYGRDFKAAFEKALSGLKIADRNLLRMHLIDEASIDELAKIHDIHRATAARRLGAIRKELAQSTLTYLGDSLGIADPDELNSVLRLVRSRLDLSLVRVLATKPK